jgi:hypothetical protein
MTTARPLSAVISRSSTTKNMNVSSVSCGSGTDATDAQNKYKQTRADFDALAKALQSGDLASSQQAFTQLQKDNPRLAQTLSSAPSSSDSPRVADLKNIASSLQSGDVTGAQTALTKLQQDAQAVAGQQHHHHHHAAAPAAATSPATDTDGDSSDPATGSVLNATA